MAALSSMAAAPSALSLFLAAVARGGSSSTSPLAALQLGLANLLQGPASSLLDLIPPILLAVPKSKISHSRKSMRSANKGLPEKLSEWAESGERGDADQGLTDDSARL